MDLSDAELEEEVNNELPDDEKIVEDDFEDEDEEEEIDG